MARQKGVASRKGDGKPSTHFGVRMNQQDYNDLADLANKAEPRKSVAMVAEELIVAGLYGVQVAAPSSTEKDLRTKIHEQKLRIEALERAGERDAEEIGQLNKQLRSLRSEVQNHDINKELEEVKARLARALHRIGELTLG